MKKTYDEFYYLSKSSNCLEKLRIFKKQNVFRDKISRVLTNFQNEWKTYIKNSAKGRLFRSFVGPDRDNEHFPINFAYFFNFVILENKNVSSGV